MQDPTRQKHETYDSIRGSRAVASPRGPWLCLGPLVSFFPVVFIMSNNTS